MEINTCEIVFRRHIVNLAHSIMSADLNLVQSTEAVGILLRPPQLNCCKDLT